MDCDSQFQKNYETIRKEILAYGKKVSEKNEIILISKSDPVDPETIHRRINLLKEITRSNIRFISSHKGTGLKELKNDLEDFLND